MADDITFSRGPARRPAPKLADPLLQWATGLPTDKKAIYAGWLCEAGRDIDFDEAMQRAGYQRVTIKHGTGKHVTHWALERVSLFIITDGVQSMAEMGATSERLGIAFGWKTLPGGRQQSQLRCRALVHELLNVGYTEPVMITLKGTITGDFLTALNAQFAALEALDTFRMVAGKPALNPPFYALSIPIGPGRDVARGSGTQTKDITPPVAEIPKPITKDYIQAHWVKKPWVALIENSTDQTIAWSVSCSKLIAADAEGTASREDAPADEEPGT
jgi:hypothetical protein